MSLRNRARFKNATILLYFLELSGYDIQQEMQSATRPNGTLNVSRLLTIAQDLTCGGIRVRKPRNLTKRP